MQYLYNILCRKALLVCPPFLWCYAHSVSAVLGTNAENQGGVSILWSMNGGKLGVMCLPPFLQERLDGYSDCLVVHIGLFYKFSYSFLIQKKYFIIFLILSLFQVISFCSVLFGISITNFLEQVP